MKMNEKNKKECIKYGFTGICAIIVALMPKLLLGVTLDTVVIVFVVAFYGLLNLIKVNKND